MRSNRKYYCNLTNGIEFMNDMYGLKFVRIQSSVCESKNWNRVINDLDYTFLMDLAMGYDVIVTDASKRKLETRAMAQGLSWIRYVLNRRWLEQEVDESVNGINVTNYWRGSYSLLTKNTKRKLDYVKKFLVADEIKLSSDNNKTTHDGDYKHYGKLIGEYRSWEMEVIKLNEW